MARWLVSDEISSAIPDAVAVYANGKLYGFDESAVHTWYEQNELDYPRCDEDCRAAGCVVAL